MYKKIILWILVILCMSLIFGFSSQEAKESDQTSTSFMSMFIRVFDAENSLEDKETGQIVSKEENKIVDESNRIVRKGAHFLIYAVLGGLVFLLIRQYRPGFLYPLANSTVISMIYACSDEIHQIFVPGRAGRISDVFLDTSGALCGAGALLLINLIFQSKNNINNIKGGIKNEQIRRNTNRKKS